MKADLISSIRDTAPIPPFAHHNVKRLRVLLVEDDPLDAKIVDRVARSLTRHELAIDWVNSVAQAYAALDRSAYDLHVVDFWLGHENSLKLIAASSAQAPTIVLSYSNDAATRRNCQLAGADLSLDKTKISAATLEAAVEQATRRSLGTAQ